MIFDFETSLNKVLETHRAQIDLFVDIGNYMGTLIASSTSDLIGRRLADEEYDAVAAAYRSALNFTSHSWCTQADKMLKECEKGGENGEKP